MLLLLLRIAQLQLKQFHYLLVVQKNIVQLTGKGDSMLRLKEMKQVATQMRAKVERARMTLSINQQHQSWIQTHPITGTCQDLM